MLGHVRRRLAQQRRTGPCRRRRRPARAPARRGTRRGSAAIDAALTYGGLHRIRSYGPFDAGHQVAVQQRDALAERVPSTLMRATASASVADVGGVDRAAAATPARPAPRGCRCRCTGRARAARRTRARRRASPSAISSAMNERGTIARSSTWNGTPAASLARQVRGGLARRDAARDQRLDARTPRTPTAGARACSSSASSGRLERPQHQPGRFVEGVRRAMPKRNARLFEAGALALARISMQRHRQPGLSSTRR